MNKNVEEYIQNCSDSFTKIEKKLTSSRIKKLEILQEKFCISFSNLSLLDKALTHRSWHNVKDHTGILYNQRLEFLGDSILSSIISEYLFCSYPYLDEGGLSRLKSVVVSRKTLTSLALQNDLIEYVKLGKSEKSNLHNSGNSSILGDTMEAIIGAYHLDMGYEKCSIFVMNLFLPLINQNLQKGRSLNYKSMLQEIIQKREKKVPLYVLEKTEGPSHNRQFWVYVMIDDEKLASGTGFSKKEAEIKAAKNALTIHYQDKIGEISIPNIRKIKMETSNVEEKHSPNLSTPL